MGTNHNKMYPSKTPQLVALIALAAALTLQLSQGDNENSCRNSGVFVNYMYV